MFRHFDNTVTLNLDLIALGSVSLKVIVTRYLASPSAKCCKNLFNLSFDRGVIMGFFHLQLSHPANAESLWDNFHKRSRDSTEIPSWKGRGKSPGLVPRFISKKTEAQKSEGNAVKWQVWVRIRIFCLRRNCTFDSATPLFPCSILLGSQPDAGKRTC